MVEASIQITSYEIGPPTLGTQGEIAVLRTNLGDITCLYRQVAGAEAVVLWAGAVRGEEQNLGASSIPQAVSADLAQDGIASLLLRYRHPFDLYSCISDARASVSFLENQGFHRIAVVGHSFSGAVAISVAPLSRAIVAAVALASQTFGAQGVPHVSPRPILLVHGLADHRLNAYCSEQIYSWARQPKELVLLEGASHGLWERKDDLLPLLRRWLADKLRPPRPKQEAAG